MYLGEVRKVNGSGCENAAGLIQLSIVWWWGRASTPGHKVRAAAKRIGIVRGHDGERESTLRSDDPAKLPATENCVQWAIQSEPAFFPRPSGSS